MAEINPTQLRSAVAWSTGTPHVEEDDKSPWEWFWEAVQGDFNENRSTGQIVADAAISMIPLALAAVGRARLWIDQTAMCEFINANLSHPALANEPYLKDPPEPSIAPSLIARHAFTPRPTRWCFVEPIDGEFEFVKDDTDSSAPFPPSEKRRFRAGEICDRSGYYFTPARVDSRHKFGIGEIFPEVDSVHGNTIWQWDARQD